MKKDRNIIFILPTLGLGGMERVVTELSNHLVQDNYIVSIVTLIKHTIQYDINPKVELITSDIDYTGTIFNKLKIMLNLRHNLKRIKSEENVFLSFGERFNSLSILACRSLGIKEIFVSDRNNPYANNGYVNDKLRNALYPFAKGIIAQTTEAQKHFHKLKLNENILVLNNPIKQIQYKGDSPKSHTILTVGRLDKLKNHEELIDIFTAINDDTWNLVIVGGGELYDHLKSKIENNPLQHNIFLEGPKSNVDDYLNDAEIFAFTSLSEGFPNVLIEAMSVPLACIAYDCKVGPADIIDHNKNGILIPLKNRELFTSELKQLMNDKERRNILKNEAIKVREKYNINEICRHLVDFINTKTM